MIKKTNKIIRKRKKKHFNNKEKKFIKYYWLPWNAEDFLKLIEKEIIPNDRIDKIQKWTWKIQIEYEIY